MDRDQSARSVQSDLDLYLPQQPFLQMHLLDQCQNQLILHNILGHYRSRACRCALHKCSILSQTSPVFYVSASLYKSFENTVGKGEIAHNEHCGKRRNCAQSFPKQAPVLRVCSSSLLKILWEKEKLLIMSTVGKGEIAHNEQSILFPQCFLPFRRTFCHFYKIKKMSSASSFILEEYKICRLGKS